MTISFIDWLGKQSRRNDPIGDLATDMRHDFPPERIVTPGDFLCWVGARGGCSGALDAIMQANDEWMRLQTKRDVSVRVRFLVFQRDSFACCLCGRDARDGVKLEVDHIAPIVRGGSNAMDNLQTLCWDCNRGKRDSLL
jgi:hypothetical protein